MLEICSTNIQNVKYHNKWDIRHSYVATSSTAISEKKENTAKKLTNRPQSVN